MSHINEVTPKQILYMHVYFYDNAHVPAKLE